MLTLQTKKLYRQHLITPKNIVVVFDHGSPVTIPAANSDYERIKALLLAGDTDSLGDEVDKALKITTRTKGKFVVLNGAVNIDGEPLPAALSRRLIDMVDAEEDTTRLERFWDNLSQNPTQSAREDLYAFLTANDVAITQDGCIVVYRSVRQDYWDHRTGNTFLSSPGAIVEMDRAGVDHNRSNTCSTGMHVAAWGYAHTFGGNNRVMECKVNPRDVVAVPPDYSQQKMRVCKAQIIKEVTQEFSGMSYDEEESDGDSEDSIVDLDLQQSLKADKKGRVRIPGKFLRALGAGVGSQVEVVVESLNDGQVLIQLPTDRDDYHFWTTLTVIVYNSVRVSPETLAAAGTNRDEHFEALFLEDENTITLF